jgi:hypothetical protein
MYTGQKIIRLVTHSNTATPRRGRQSTQNAYIWLAPVRMQIAIKLAIYKKFRKSSIQSFEKVSQWQQSKQLV